ncbi:hypothetical protein BZA05DRAFT_403604, partial [Tricharina praecox]|uniref:uncharacterized protein n=1 Tax=Tricharina praecox TaxID=43433 RepID=UPI00221E3EB0
MSKTPAFVTTDEKPLTLPSSGTPSDPPVSGGNDGPHFFTPRTTLTVNALGIPWLRFPLTVKELTTTILRDSVPAYQSVRFKRSSGSCVLTAMTAAGVAGAAEEVARTTYFFGPGKRRSPVLTIGEETVRALRVGRFCTMNRDCTFMWKGERCEWVYQKEMRPAVTSSDGVLLKTKVLVLYIGEGAARRKVAELVRNRETRTKGSGGTWAGNGGALVIGDGVDEALVVATVLVMLKKEVDRRRTHQILIISGMSGG